MTSFFFFFQAEDGIRDFHVTGVQTCTLPIYRVEGVQPADHVDDRGDVLGGDDLADPGVDRPGGDPPGRVPSYQHDLDGGVRRVQPAYDLEGRVELQAGPEHQHVGTRGQVGQRAFGGGQRGDHPDALAELGGK